MQLTDRRRLARLMVIQGVSQRDLARAAGWRSHSYLGRLLRGQVDTLADESAVQIAQYLGVGTSDLFATEETRKLDGKTQKEGRGVAESSHADRESKTT